MYSTCIYYGLDDDNFSKFSEKIKPLNSSGKLIRFTNVYHLLSALRVYGLLIEKTKQEYPTHIFFDEHIGSVSYTHFMDVFDQLRHEDSEIHEISLLQKVRTHFWDSLRFKSVSVNFEINFLISVKKNMISLKQSVQPQHTTVLHH